MQHMTQYPLDSLSLWCVRGPGKPRLVLLSRCDDSARSPGLSTSVWLCVVPAATLHACTCCPSSHISHEDEQTTAEHCSLSQTGCSYHHTAQPDRQTQTYRHTHRQTQNNTERLSHIQRHVHTISTLIWFKYGSNHGWWHSRLNRAYVIITVYWTLSVVIVTTVKDYRRSMVHHTSADIFKLLRDTDTVTTDNS